MFRTSGSFTPEPASSGMVSIDTLMMPAPALAADRPRVANADRDTLGDEVRGQLHVGNDRRNLNLDRGFGHGFGPEVDQAGRRLGGGDGLRQAELFAGREELLHRTDEYLGQPRGDGLLVLVVRVSDWVGGL